MTKERNYLVIKAIEVKKVIRSHVAPVAMLSVNIVSPRDCAHRFSKRNSSAYSATTSAQDIFLLFLGIILLVVGTPGLRIITGVMVLWQLVEEAIQLKTQNKYLKSTENLLDITMLLLVPLLLVLPDV